MKTYVMIGEETTHTLGDPQCPECWEGYPESCSCGGLIHAAGEQFDPDGPDLPAITRCDRCGRSEEELH